MLARYGPQGWWPVAPAPGRPARYDPRWTQKPLTPTQQYEVAVGAVLTQNTAWTNVEKALDALRRARALRPERWLAVRPVRLEEWIRPSGFFRQKTKALRGLAAHLRDRWSGRLDRLLARPMPEARSALLALNGFGPETADSILLYAGRHPVFVVDAYTRRVAHRLRLFRYNNTDMIQAYFYRQLPRRVPFCREAHALFVAHAKAHCRAVPRCGDCPLRVRCPEAPRG
ncbi:MAG: hypothetical protein IPP68_08300 [Elusimicrobia bacterium]|nr:hypothetical protein [Elusimicrobiota bacterium]